MIIYDHGWEMMILTMALRNGSETIMAVEAMIIYDHGWKVVIMNLGWEIEIMNDKASRAMIMNHKFIMTPSQVHRDAITSSSWRHHKFIVTPSYQHFIFILCAIWYLGLVLKLGEQPLNFYLLFQGNCVGIKSLLNVTLHLICHPRACQRFLKMEEMEDT